MAENIVFGFAAVAFVVGAPCLLLGLVATKTADVLGLGDPDRGVLKWLWRVTLAGLATTGVAVVVAIVGVYAFQYGDDTESATGTAGEVRRSTSTVPADPYEVAQIAFIGGPSRAELEPLFRTVLTGTGATYNDHEVGRLSDVLVALRQDSVTGVTEVEILECMARSVPLESVAYHELAALAYTILESNNRVCL